MPAGKEVHQPTKTWGDNFPGYPMVTIDATGAEDASEGHVDADGRICTDAGNCHHYEIRPVTVADQFEDGYNQYTRPKGPPATPPGGG